MKKTLLISCLLFAFFTSSAAKPDTSTLTGRDIGLKIKWNAVGLFNLFSLPCLQFTVERPLSRHFSASGEIGIGFKPLTRGSYDSTAVRDAPGYKANAELRYYFKNSARREHLYPYVGLNLGYRYERFNQTIVYSIKPDSVIENRDLIGVVKNFYGSAVIVGFEMRRGHFVMDLNLGIGALQKNIQNTQRIYDTAVHRLTVNAYPKDAPGSWPLQNNLREASGLKANFIVAFRLGYMIYKKKEKTRGR